jgi:CarD family transcriptional regulator
MRPQQKVSVRLAPYSRSASKAAARPATEEIKFELGQKVFYAGHGVGQVVSIETREFTPGVTKSYYVIRILETGVKAWIPPTEVQKVGVRPIASTKEVEEVFAMLTEKKIVVEQSTWNRRHREYMEKIKTGSIFEIAEVLRDLCILRGEKVLSFGERKMLELAKGLLVKELAIAQLTDEPTIEAQIEALFAPAQ